jgi:sarcosine oxidase subunit alpha
LPCGEYNVDHLSVENMIIGGGVSGISLLENLNEVILISDNLNDDIFFDSLADRNITEKIKSIINNKKEKIINGLFLGKFDEGYLVKSEKTLLVINAKNIIFANGGRYIPPLFKNNDMPGIISRRMYLRNGKLLKKVIVIGSSDDALRTAILARSKVLYKKGTEMFSKKWIDIAEREGIDIIGVDKISVDIKGKSLRVNFDGIDEKVNAIVYAIVKQPRLEAISNSNIDYVFYSFSHIYLPSHDINGRTKDNIYIIGGSRAISDYETSFLSAKIIFDEKYIDDFSQKINETEPYLMPFYSKKWENRVSPYIFGNQGYFCECEDITFSDVVNEKMKGYKTVEDIKRTTGACTGACQGKICSYLLGSYLESEKLITFRSPLYPLW